MTLEEAWKVFQEAHPGYVVSWTSTPLGGWAQVPVLRGTSKVVVALDERAQCFFRFGATSFDREPGLPPGHVWVSGPFVEPCGWLVRRVKRLTRSLPGTKERGINIHEMRKEVACDNHPV